MGLIAKTNKVVRQIGFGLARASGPVLMAAGGLALAGGTAQTLWNGRHSGFGDMANNAIDYAKGVAAPAALAIGGGLVLTKVTGAALKG